MDQVYSQPTNQTDDEVEYGSSDSHHDNDDYDTSDSNYDDNDDNDNHDTSDSNYDDDNDNRDDKNDDYNDDDYDIRRFSERDEQRLVMEISRCFITNSTPRTGNDQLTTQELAMAPPEHVPHPDDWMMTSSSGQAPVDPTESRKSYITTITRTTEHKGVCHTKKTPDSLYEKGALQRIRLVGY